MSKADLLRVRDSLRYKNNIDLMTRVWEEEGCRGPVQSFLNGIRVHLVSEEIQPALTSDLEDLPILVTDEYPQIRAISRYRLEKGF